MKKVLTLVLSICLLLTSSFSLTSFASDLGETFKTTYYSKELDREIVKPIPKETKVSDSVSAIASASTEAEAKLSAEAEASAKVPGAGVSTKASFSVISRVKNEVKVECTITYTITIIDNLTGYYNVYKHYKVIETRQKISGVLWGVEKIYLGEIEELRYVK